MSTKRYNSCPNRCIKRPEPHIRLLRPDRYLLIQLIQLQLYKLRILHQLNMFPVKLHQQFLILCFHCLHNVPVKKPGQFHNLGFSAGILQIFLTIRRQVSISLIYLINLRTRHLRCHEMELNIIFLMVCQLFLLRQGQERIYISIQLVNILLGSLVRTFAIAVILRT